MSSMIGKDKLVFDATEMADSDNVGAFVRASDGTLITHTQVGAKEALDVYISGGELSGTYDEDTAHTSGDAGMFMLAVRNDANTSLVSADGDYAPLQVDADGRLKVSAEVTVEAGDAEYLEDTAHASGDAGIHMLAVRQDTLASSVSADGDYASFKLNSVGALWVAPVGNVADDAADSGNPLKVASRSEWGVLPAISADGDRADMISDKYRRVYVNNGANIGVKATATTVTDTAAVILASALSGRRQLNIQNLGNKPIYIGDSAVSAASGWRVAAGSAITVELGEDVSLYAVADTGISVATRVLELA